MIQYYSGKQNRAVNLLELMVVIAIIAILAIVSYSAYVRLKMESRRADAQNSVMAAEGMVERYLSENDIANLASSDLDSGGQFAAYSTTSSAPQMSNAGYYRITITTDSVGYSITATATVDTTLTSCSSSSNATLEQCNDTLCREIILYHGERESQDSSGDLADATTTQCW